MITSVAFYVYPVRDLTQACQFYEDILGLKPGCDSRDEWIEYDVNGSTFAITTMDDTHVAGANGGVIAFEVDNFDAEIERLKDSGVKFVLDKTASPVCRFAIIADPDGNHVIIHKLHAT